MTQMMLDAAATEGLLDHRGLLHEMEVALQEYDDGKITCPERLVMECSGRGLLLSMPCCAADAVTHKLVTVFPGNHARHLPTIHGQASCWDAETGEFLFALDGPTLTARRTAAISMVAVSRLLPEPPRRALVFGTGTQARAHIDALLALYPGIEIAVRGRTSQAAHVFAQGIARSDRVVAASDNTGANADLVITATTSQVPIYDAPPKPSCLVVGVGAFRPSMAEIGARTLSGSLIYVDDPVGARAEAGDLIQAGTDWNTVRPLANALTAPPDFSRPIVFKSVGCAAWDLAACRAARRQISVARRGAVSNATASSFRST